MRGRRRPPIQLCEDGTLLVSSFPDAAVDPAALATHDALAAAFEVHHVQRSASGWLAWLRARRPPRPPPPFPSAAPTDRALAGPHPGVDAAAVAALWADGHVTLRSLLPADETAVVVRPAVLAAAAAHAWDDTRSSVFGYEAEAPGKVHGDGDVGALVHPGWHTRAACRGGTAVRDTAGRSVLCACVCACVRRGQGKSFLRVHNLHRVDPAVRSLVTSPRLARVARQLLKVDAVRLYQDSAFLKAGASRRVCFACERRVFSKLCLRARA
jgi:hypothetical protein